MEIKSILGARVCNRSDGADYVKLLHKCGFSFVIIDCTDISQSIKILKKLPRETNIVAHLDKRTVYTYLDKDKDMVASYALLYDFVDAFLISGYDELSDDIDQLINLRLYNDEYRPILMDIPDDMLHDELDNVIAYARLSSIDGLVVSNPRLLKYAASRSAGSLMIVGDGVSDCAAAEESLAAGANYISVRTGIHPLLSFFLRRRIVKRLGRSVVENA